MKTAWLRTLYVLFAIEIGSPRVHILGVTANPDSAWVTQQARNQAVGERLQGVRFLIRDRDSKFSGLFDEVFRTEGVKVVKTPIRAPKANAFAERWVRTVRTECLDWMLVFGRRHLERILEIYTAHYNGRRPHRGLELKTPDPRTDRLHIRSSVGGFGGTIYSVATSMSTRLPLEPDPRFVCPFTLQA